MQKDHSFEGRWLHAFPCSAERVVSPHQRHRWVWAQWQGSEEQGLFDCQLKQYLRGHLSTPQVNVPGLELAARNGRALRAGWPPRKVSSGAPEMLGVPWPATADDA